MAQWLSTLPTGAAERVCKGAVRAVKRGHVGAVGAMMGVGLVGSRVWAWWGVWLPCLVVLWVRDQVHGESHAERKV